MYNLKVRIQIKIKILKYFNFEICLYSKFFKIQNSNFHLNVDVYYYSMSKQQIKTIRVKCSNSKHYNLCAQNITHKLPIKHIVS